MQFFDSATLVLLALTLLGYLWTCGSWNRRVNVAAVLTGGFAILHLLVEGFRWQMVPAYVVIAAILVAVGWRLMSAGTTQRAGRRVRHWLGAIFGWLFLALAALLSYAFPIFELPEPSGSHAIGTMELHLIDENRGEGYTAIATDRRELMLRVWYPAEPTPDDARAAYWRDTRARSRAVTGSTPLPWFTFTHLGSIPTNSYWDAPVAARGPYPVVMYSHGIGLGWASGNTALAEGLASSGYVVIGINHAYIGSLSVFPDGRRITFDEQTSRAMSQPPDPEVGRLQSRLIASTDWQEQVAIYQQAMTLMPNAALEYVGKGLSVQVADQRFVLDALERMQRNDEMPLALRLDLTRVGLMGMSLGGSAALETCSIDRRCKAGVNLDGFHPRHIGLSLEDTPFLFVNRSANLLYNSNFQISTAPVYSARIADVTHFNFFDFSIMSPLYKRLGVLGPLDGYRALAITEAYVRGFFDEHLRGLQGQRLDTLALEYPEVTFRQRNVD